MEIDMRVKVFIKVQRFSEEYFPPFIPGTDAVRSRKDHIK
jgi:hypothetical protein